MFNYIKILFIIAFWTITLGLKPDRSIRNARYKDMLRSMNLAAEPCEDFYEFACGNAANAKSKSANEPNDEAPTIEQLLRINIDRHLKAMLDEDLLKQDDHIYGRKVKNFYKSCKTAKRNGKVQQAFFGKVISENGGFPAVPGANWSLIEPNYKWHQVIAHLRLDYAMDILIKIRVVPRKYNDYPTDKYLEPADTLIPPHLCSVEGTKRVELQSEAYNAIRKEVAENLSGWLTMNMKEARQVAIDVVTFEYELCKGIETKVEDTRHQYKPEHLSELSRALNDSIDLKNLLTLSYGTPIYKPFIIASWRYFEQLAKVTQAHSKVTVANYIMYRALSKLSVPADENSPARSDYCLALMKQYFPKQIGEMYLKKYVDVNVEYDVRLMYQNLTEPFTRVLAQTPWRDHVTNSRLYKIALQFPPYAATQPVKVQVTPDNFWQNLAEVLHEENTAQMGYILESHILPTADEVESYEARVLFRPERDRIEMGWGILLLPYYHQEYPVVMRYAVIGQMLARELARAFAYLNTLTELPRRRGQNELAAEQLSNRLNCLQNQISNYLYNRPFRYENATEVSELMAVSNGLNLAFSGYSNWLNSPHVSLALLRDETLSELNYTNTQLFFIAFAQMFCQTAANATNTTVILSVLQQHSLARYRVNGPMMNSIEFARDFHCAIGVEMNVPDKCVIF